MKTRGEFLRNLPMLLLVLFVVLTTGLILLGAHLQALQGIMPVNNYNGLFIMGSLDNSVTSMIPITGQFKNFSCDNTLFCDDFATGINGWSTDHGKLSSVENALRITSGLFPVEMKVMWEATNDGLPNLYKYSAEVWAEKHNQDYGLMIFHQDDSTSTVFVINPDENLVSILSISDSSKYTPIAQIEFSELEAWPNSNYLEVRCLKSTVEFWINGTLTISTNISQICGSGSVGVYKSKDAWKIWVDNVSIVPDN